MDQKILTTLQQKVLNLFDLPQLIILAVVFVTALLLQPVLRWLLAPIARRVLSPRWQEKIAPPLHRLSLPLTALVLTKLAIIVTATMGQPAALLEIVRQMVFFWLGYRLGCILLEANLGPDKAGFWSKNVLLPLTIGAAILGATGSLSPLLEWGFTIPSMAWRLTLGSVLLAVVSMLIFLLLARWVRRSLAEFLLAGAGLEPAIITTTAQVAGYVVAFIGLLVPLGLMGIYMTGLTVIGGGLSVGLAFGLQEIFNNFVSGFILLFERSLLPGDVVQINNLTGTVKKVGMRSTIVTTRDNVELIVPNSRFLTEIVTNMTHTDALVRTRINVGVSYKAHPRTVEALLLEVAQNHPDVLAEPAPGVGFVDFGESEP
jgi:small-conductance mechanosensitive channel